MTHGGFLLINKPKSWTSHDVVDKLRKITGIKKIGHAGTLDPFATGLLILLIGKDATKQQSFFLHLDKTYWTKIRLNATSDTYDLTGKIEEAKIKKIPNINKIKEITNNFIGELQQIPPPFSAKKIKGEKAYELARQGKKFELKPQNIKIYSLEILNYNWPYLEIRVNVSSGTYIRSLAYDIGKCLGVGGLVDNLKRESIGEYRIEQAVGLDKLTSENWQSHLLAIS
jgi:tRNA pseudouridine55 synthase